MVFDESVRNEPRFGELCYGHSGGSPDDHWILYTSAGDKNGGGVSFAAVPNSIFGTKLIYFAVDIVDEEHLPKEQLITIK